MTQYAMGVEKKTSYVAKKPNASGYVDYNAEENSIWQDLIVRQSPLMQTHACPEFLEGLKQLNLPHDRVPQSAEISQALTKATKWSVMPVDALIHHDYFFSLLANRQFPAATFVRRRDELDYLEEPDIFHEYFGHCPMLTNPAYADFMQKYGELGLKVNDDERLMLARLYWFTVEFGLVNTKNGLRVYGGGILSSKKETIYALESNVPERKAFTPLDALRTPYRIDIVQPVYFVVNAIEDLYQLLTTDLVALMAEAKRLGEYPATF